MHEWVSYHYNYLNVGNVSPILQMRKVNELVSGKDGGFKPCLTLKLVPLPLNTAMPSLI